MDADKILKNNPFADCDRWELQEYWDELKTIYSTGVISFGAKLKQMRDTYYKSSEIPLIALEQDLFMAIACEFFEERK